MQPTVIGAIDAGSNAIRMAIASVDASGLHALFSERVPVRLGHNAFTQEELDGETIDQALNTFLRFRKLFDEHHVEHYRAVATSALRHARNREFLQDRIWIEAGIRLDVIDGDEEARLSGKAVAHAFEGKTPPRTVLDLGGGSLEVSVRKNDVWATASLRVGTVRLLETFGLTGVIDQSEARMVRRYVKTALQSSKAIRGATGLLPAAICGGNADALAKLFGNTDGAMAKLTVEQLKSGLPSLLEATVPERMDRFGFTRDRAEVIGIAALVFLAAAKELEVDQFLAPGVGIREGVLHDLAGDVRKERAPGVGARRKALLGSARAFAERMGHDIAHGENVRRLARALFDQTRDIHGLGDHDRTTLELGALLHDVGEVVHRQSHHKHSEYLIRSGRIPGLKDADRAMIAALARGHRKSAPDEKHPAFAELGGKARDVARTLTAILRLADSLDTDHRQRIASLKTKRNGKELELALTVASDQPGQSPPLRKQEALEDVLGLKIVLAEPKRS